MYDVKLNATLNHDLKMSRLGAMPRGVRREPPKYLLPEGPACAGPSRMRRLRDESTYIGLREAEARIRLTRAEAVAIITIFLALLASAALIGYANGVADAALRYTSQSVGVSL